MRVNLDAISGSALRPEALAAFQTAVENGWSDPQRAHREGRRARALLDEARERTASALGIRVDEVAFTGSLSQAHRRAVAGLAIGRARVATRAVASAVEHSALLHACASLGDGWRTPDSQRWQLALAPVNSDGAVDADSFCDSVLNEPTAFAVLQTANSEVGTRQPLGVVSSRLTEQVPMLVDGTAMLGEPDFADLPWNVMTASGAHIGAPVACAVLAVRTGTRWRSPDRPTDAYEHGWVPGQPNVADIAAFSAALEASAAESERATRLRALTARIREAIPQLVTDCVVVGADDARVSHIVTASFLYVSGAALAAELDDAGFAVASGSACASDALTASHVLAAMGALTEGNIRISLGWDTTAAQVEQFLAALPGCVARVRERFGAPV